MSSNASFAGKANAPVLPKGGDSPEAGVIGGRPNFYRKNQPGDNIELNGMDLSTGEPRVPLPEHLYEAPTRSKR